MKTKMKTLLVPAVTATALLIGGNAQALLIDDFNGGDSRVPTIPGGETLTDTEYANAVGGWRRLQVSPDGDILRVSDGRLTAEEGGASNDPNSTLVRWKGGPDSSDTINPPVDLTDGGSSDRVRFVFTDVDFLDNPTLTFRVNSVGGDTEATIRPTRPGIVDVLFSDFQILSGGRSFDEVFLIDLVVDTATGTTLAIDNISTVVPVPAAVWLFGSALVGLVGVARRREMAAA